ncbi:hypothetical protein [Acidovorax sp. PRC11]|uniref:hypothetical protein n=1 Tax=Acidovorax sp. PRC11 TaxID=2962592 RepID=UPI002882ACF4|nr:hypothetical protein [Acidovorax sp. PRC11]MDT0139097.1 hypothetical protein [Acidovorax sp. PRC11]
MLRVEKATLGKFGEPELASLIDLRGWQSVLPDALEDQQLLLVSDQLRDLLAGQGWDTARGPGSAALPISLLLLSKAGAKRSGEGLDVAMDTLHQVMTLLSVTVDREIVNRMLHRQDGCIGAELMQGLRLLVQNVSEPFESRCPA